MQWLVGKASGKTLFAPATEINARTFQESPVQSWTELMNFVLISAGLEKDSIHPDTDLDALNPEEIENMVSRQLKTCTVNLTDK